MAGDNWHDFKEGLKMVPNFCSRERSIHVAAYEYDIDMEWLFSFSV
jgi:hypothetical protein